MQIEMKTRANKRSTEIGQDEVIIYGNYSKI